MARRKGSSSRTGETVFTDPREAARHIRSLIKSGAKVYGTRAAMSAVGVQPHHFMREVGQRKGTTKGLPRPEAQILAEHTDEVAGPVSITYAPTATSDPTNPRTAAAGYDPVLRRLRIEWGDGGPAYNYYDVPPQIWDSFQQAPSPGRYIDAVLNYFSYGPAE